MRFIHSDRGIAGLEVLLSVVVTIFIIGFIVTIFAIMGGELQDETYDEGTSVTVTGEACYINTTTYTSDYANSKRDFATFTITTAVNKTDETLITSGNYTATSAGLLSNLTATEWMAVEINYTYTYSKGTTATTVTSNVTDDISGVTDWFNIFILITAMVVLILLTVIIINALRGSGIVFPKEKPQGGASSETA